MVKKPNANALNLQEVARAAAIEALKLQKDEERQRKRRNRFHNTELLLKNYLSLTEHFQNTQDSASGIPDLDELLELEGVELDDVIIQSIRRSRIRTMVMVRHIDTSLEVLRLKLVAKNQSEKYEVIHKLYCDPELINTQWTERIRLVAIAVRCGEASVKRWKNEMIEDLSILLFGVDGLRLEV